ncbi:MAG TPA: DAK2 domain-containing protein [Gaiellales bacterium]|jgi:DAK2 domain fusion protein YloV|nr:DAK2 domain-containing protein [Gaiellales bacterium]
MTSAPTAGDALALVRLAASGAAGALARHASRIDEINVFPVPDGDTGANLSRTARSVLDALQANSQPEPSAIARVGARAALLGARGNSGIILSQLVRGACERLGEGGPLDGPAIADALRRASTEADAALRDPVEGTILTVARALADGAEAANSPDPIATLAAGLVAAELALVRTTDMLPSLRAAGVVDAGGAGLVELVRGALAALRGEAVAEAAPLWEHAHDPVTADYEGPRYCTGFLVAGAFPREQLELQLAPLGDCLVVVSDGELVRAHLHTDQPGLALSAATALGSLSGVEISDMYEQRDALAERAGRPVALEDDGRLADVLAIVDGDGNQVLYASLGARLLLRGRPTADELLAAIRTSPAAAIVLLPNDPGLQVVAEYAAQAASVPVHVVPSRGLAQGLAALVAYRTDQPAGVLAAAFAAAAAWAGSAEVSGGANDAAALREAVGRALAPGSTLVTVLAGANAEQTALDSLAAWLREAHPSVELELHAGGQAHPRYSVSAE